jgi:hypothetical protein
MGKILFPRQLLVYVCSFTDWQQRCFRNPQATASNQRLAKLRFEMVRPLNSVVSWDEFLRSGGR